jgi:tail assembly chaperone E/41/14-like protein
MSEPVTVKLQHPIRLGESQVIEELIIRPLTGRDLRRLPQASNLDTTLALAGRLSGQPDAVIDRLTGEDLAEVLQAVDNFMPSGRPTGSAPSGS